VNFETQLLFIGRLGFLVCLIDFLFNDIINFTRCQRTDLNHFRDVTKMVVNKISCIHTGASCLLNDLIKILLAIITQKFFNVCREHRR